MNYSNLSSDLEEFYIPYKESHLKDGYGYGFRQDFGNHHEYRNGDEYYYPTGLGYGYVGEWVGCNTRGDGSDYGYGQDPGWEYNELMLRDWDGK
jgi:hypothetical protein